MLLCTGGISPELQNPSTLPGGARPPRGEQKCTHMFRNMRLTEAHTHVETNNAELVYKHPSTFCICVSRLTLTGASEIATELTFDQFCVWVCISSDPSSGNNPSCTGDKNGVCFGHRGKKEKYVISCGKRSEACGHHDSPQKNTFLRVAIMV